MPRLPNNLEELLKCMHTIETCRPFRIGQEVHVHCYLIVDDALGLSSRLHVNKTKPSSLIWIAFTVVDKSRIYF